ncbi:MAG: hypothetical protein M3350_03525 [Actinomycetota bacterium]|nr:hypothetical protein [Actinomycetota bacterium]
MLRLIVALLQTPVRRLAGLLGLDGAAARPAAPSFGEADRVADPTRGRAHRDASRPTPPAPAPAPVVPAPPPPFPSQRVKEVDEEPVLVAEFAEEGAQDGAGAEVHVDEPWEGYSRMRVREVQDRLTSATTAELAAVQLFEATHRKRASVLQAVDGRMRSRPS